MFVCLTNPPPIGTMVAISIEAAGRVFALTTAQVRWCRPTACDGHPSGCGVRFVQLVSPRAAELIDALVDTLRQGRRVRKAFRTPSWGRRFVPTLLAASALTLLVAWWTWRPRDTSAVRSKGTSSELAFGSALGAESLPRMESLSPVFLSDAPKTGEPREAGVERALNTNDVSLEHNPTDSTSEETGKVRSEQLALPSGAARFVHFSPSNERTLEIRPGLRPSARIVRVFSLQNPPRLVFDIDGPGPRKSHVVSLHSTRVSKVRVGLQPRGTRVVVELVSEPARIDVKRGTARLTF
jgi:hypothetical protein